LADGRLPKAAISADHILYSFECAVDRAFTPGWVREMRRARPVADVSARCLGRHCCPATCVV
jgi:hypothetical protein